MELTGRLLYQGPENTLVALDLRDLTVKTVVRKLPFSANDGLVKKTEGKVIVSVASKLMEIDLVSEDARIIDSKYVYRAEAYLPNSDTLFYLDGKNSHLGLFEAKANDISNTAKRIGTETNSGYVGVVVVSDHEIIFPSTEYHGKIWHYDVSTKALRLIENIDNCWPIYFREVTKQLLCATSQKGEYELVTLSGERKGLINFPRSASPLLYIERHDVMLYTQAAWWPFGEYRNLYAYDLKTGESKLLKENMGLPAGLIIYLR